MNADKRVRFFGSDGSIQADISAGEVTGSYSDGNFGKISTVTAWGNVSGAITAVTSIAGVDAGGTVSATLTAPSGGVDTVTQHDTSQIGTRPMLGDVGQAALAAGVRGLVAQGQQLQAQLAQEATAVQQQMAASSEQAQQTYATVISEFSTARSQALAGGRTQHEKDWQANLDRVMAALAGTTLSGQISNGASYCWNIYVALNLGALQGVLNDLVLVGNTVVNADEFLLSPAGNLWYGKVFGLTNLQIPSARGLIINEPDWEYTWSQRFANAGIILVSLDLPIGGAGAEESAIGNLGAASTAIPRLITAEEAAPIIAYLKQNEITVEFDIIKNQFVAAFSQVQLATVLEETPAGVFYEEVQHALDYLADKAGFLEDLGNNPGGQSAFNLFYHSGVFERIATNPFFNLSELEIEAILDAAYSLRVLGS